MYFQQICICEDVSINFVSLLIHLRFKIFSENLEVIRFCLDLIEIVALQILLIGLGRSSKIIDLVLLTLKTHAMLDETYDMLTSKRPCGPNKKADTGATYDLAKNDLWKEPFESLSDHAFGNIAD
ncbi:hypothetical protein RYX36_008051 [Vicia faba]